MSLVYFARDSFVHGEFVPRGTVARVPRGALYDAIIASGVGVPSPEERRVAMGEEETETRANGKTKRSKRRKRRASQH